MGDVELTRLSDRYEAWKTTFQIPPCTLCNTAATGFRSFVIQCWSICARDPDTLALFAFNLYDLYGCGYLGLIEVQNLVSEVYGTNFGERNAASHMFIPLLCKLP